MYDTRLPNKHALKRRELHHVSKEVPVWLHMRPLQTCSATSEQLT